MKTKRQADTQGDEERPAKRNRSDEDSVSEQSLGEGQSPMDVHLPVVASSTNVLATVMSPGAEAHESHKIKTEQEGDVPPQEISVHAPHVMKEVMTNEDGLSLSSISAHKSIPDSIRSTIPAAREDTPFSSSDQSTCEVSSNLYETASEDCKEDPESDVKSDTARTTKALHPAATTSFSSPSPEVEEEEEAPQKANKWMSRFLMTSMLFVPVFFVNGIGILSGKDFIPNDQMGCKKLLSDFRRLEDELIMARLDGVHRSRKHSNGSSQPEELLSKLHMCTQETDALQTQLKSGESECSVLLTRVGQLESEKHVLSSNLETSTLSIISLTTQLQNLHQGCSELRDQLGACEKRQIRHGRFNRTKDDSIVEASCDAENNVHNQLLNENRVLVIQSKETKLELDQAKGKLKAAETTLHDKMSETELLVTRLDLQASHLEETTRTLSSTQESLRVAEQQRDNSSASLEELAVQFANTKRQLWLADRRQVELEAALAEQMEKEQEPHIALSCPDSQHNHELFENEQNVEYLSHVVETLQTELDAARRNVDDEQERRVQAENQVNLLKHTVLLDQTSSDARISCLEKELFEAQKELFEKSLLETGQHHELLSLHRHIQAHFSDLMVARDELDRKIADLRKATIAVQEMETALSKANAEIKNLEEVLQLQQEIAVKTVNDMISAAIKHEQEAAANAVNIVADMASQMNKCDA